MIGTRFLVRREANTHDLYRTAVIDATAEDAVYMQLFEGGWPDAPHRPLANATYQQWLESGSPLAGQRPGEDEEVAQRGSTKLVRYGDDIPTRDATGDISELTHYAGRALGWCVSPPRRQRSLEQMGRELREALDEITGRLS